MTVLESELQHSLQLSVMEDLKRLLGFSLTSGARSSQASSTADSAPGAPDNQSPRRAVQARDRSWHSLRCLRTIVGSVTAKEASAAKARATKGRRLSRARMERYSEDDDSSGERPVDKTRKTSPLSSREFMNSTWPTSRVELESRGRPTCGKSGGT